MVVTPNPFPVSRTSAPSSLRGNELIQKGSAQRVAAEGNGMEAETLEKLRPAVNEIRNIYAEALRVYEAEGDPSVELCLPSSVRLIALFVDAAGLRDVAYAHMEPRTFRHLLRGEGGEKVLAPLVEDLSALVLGPLTLESDAGPLVDEEPLRAAFAHACARYDGLAAVLSVSELPAELTGRAILRTLLPDLAIRRAALLLLLKQKEVTRAPLSDPHPFGAMLKLILSESRLHRGALVRVDRDDDKDHGIPSRTLADWQSGRSLPRSEQIERLAAEIVEQSRKQGGRVLGPEKMVAGWLRSARAAQKLRTALDEALGPEVVSDLLEGYERLTELAFEVLGSPDAPRAVQALILRDFDGAEKGLEQFAGWWLPARDLLAQVREGGFSDLARFLFVMGFSLHVPETREEAEAALRNVLLQWTLASGASGVPGSWVCASMAERASPGAEDLLRRLCSSDWRDVVLDYVALLALLDLIAKRAPFVRAKLAGVMDLILRLAA